MLQKPLIFSTLLLISTTGLAAEGLRVNGTVEKTITLSNDQTKTIRMMRIALSPTVSEILSNHAALILQNPNHRLTAQSSDLPSAQYIGMNGEPVLDQGNWGTCATFATTGAINAIYPLSYNARISQLCNLEVGRTLKNGDDGGWDGSTGETVLKQVNQYGYIDLSYQKHKGCGGLKKYPIDGGKNGKAMPIAQFTAHSQMHFTEKDWTPIIPETPDFKPLTPTQADIAITNIKTAINLGYRVIFGTLIDPNVGDVGTAGTYDGADQDAWVMIPQIQRDLKKNIEMEGHEMIIDGYDDTACADVKYKHQAKGTEKQCGLFHLRNSWGFDAGDDGDYYMSYAYFKLMVMDAHALGEDVRDQFVPAPMQNA